MADSAARERTELHQFPNFPTCSKTPFQKRFFGHNYDRLLKIKRRWDPDNTFKQCLGIGGDDQHCCVED